MKLPALFQLLEMPSRWQEGKTFELASGRSEDFQFTFMSYFRNALILVSVKALSFDCGREKARPFKLPPTPFPHTSVCRAGNVLSIHPKGRKPPHGGQEGSGLK